MKKKSLLALGLAAVASLSLASCGGSKKKASNPDTTQTEESEVKYEVQFFVDGGTAIAAQTVKSGEKITAVSTTKQGAIFGGWYTDSALTIAFDVNSPVTENLVLFAKWNVPGQTKYTVTFNTNGGSAVSSQEVTENTTITAVSTTRDGYKFAGWYTDSACTVAFNTSTPIVANTTLYAKWTEKVVPYNVLSAAEDNIYKNDFETAGTVDLAAISVDDSKEAGSKNSINWGARQGLYKFISKDATPNAANDATISGGKLNLINTSSTIGTQVIYDLGNPATTGMVQICVDLTLPSASIAGITPIQIYGKDTEKTTTAEVFGIRTVEATVDGTKSTFFQYRKDGVGKTQDDKGKDNSWYEGLVDGKNVNGATYTFLFKVDLSTGKISVELNGDDFVTDLDLGITEIQGIRFASGDGNTKTFTLDNLAVNGVVADVPLSEAQAKAKANLNDYVEAMGVEANYSTNAAEIEDIVTLQTAAIDSATTKELVAAAYDAAVTALKAVKSDLAIAKEAKIADLDEVYNGAKASYTDAYNGAAYTAAYNALKSAINGAATKAALDAITYDSMTSIKTDTEQAALDAMPSYQVAGVVEDVKVGDLTTTTASADIKAAKTVGAFTIAPGDTTKFKEQAGYHSLFKGNKVTFTVSNNDAIFAIAVHSATAGRKITVTNTTTTLTQDVSNDLVKDGTNFVTSYKGLTASKGFIIFEGLTAGNYTVTFDEEGAALGKCEMKFDGFVLVDHKSGSEDKKVTAINATQTLSGFDVTLTLDGVAEPVALTTTEYTVKYLNDSDEEVSFTTATKAEIAYTNAGKTIKTTVTLTA